MRQALSGEMFFGDSQLLVTEGAFVDSWWVKSHMCKRVGGSRRVPNG